MSHASVLALLFGALIPLSQARADTQPPFVAALDGSSGAVAIGADGAERTLKSGDSLAFGEKVEVRAGSAVRLAFESGSQVVAGSPSSFGVTEGASPGIELRAGTVRALVPPGRSRAVKIWIRSRAAIMGVRGTDLVVSVKEGETSLHTLDGKVEIARSAALVEAGEGVEVGAQHFVRASAEQDIPRPQRFARENFLQMLDREQPRLKRLFVEASSGVEAARIRKRFGAPSAPVDAAPETAPEAAPSASPLPSPAPSAEAADGVGTLEFQGRKKRK